MRIVRIAAAPATAGAALVLAMAAGLAASQAAPGTTGVADPPRGDVCEAPRQTPGLGEHALESGGLTRRYVVYVPLLDEGHRPPPVIVDLHGSGSTPEQELVISGMAAAARRHGALVVLPEAAMPRADGVTTWNVPEDPAFADDVGFVIDVLADVARRFCAETRQVYLTGFSGGARLASAIACRHAWRIAALAAVGGLRGVSSCSGPVPVLALHGTGDPINPFDGGGPAYWGHGAETALARWARNNRCAPDPSHTPVSRVVDRVAHGDCTGGAGVELYVLRSGGHVWPGSPFPFPEDRFGRQTALDATALVLAFFEQHGLAR